MNILVLGGSPKKKGGASAVLSLIFSLFLRGHHVKRDSVHSKEDYIRVMKQLIKVDALILSVPLYVDSMPSHILEFLIEAEKYCVEKHCHFKLYVISNSGFIEGKQNRVHLKMYQCWCKRAKVIWGGGIGIGGGVMLYWLFITYAILLTLNVLNILVSIIVGAPISAMGWSFIKNIIIYLFLNCGVLYSMFYLAKAVKREEIMNNSYTRVMIPSFIFIICADVFMILSALVEKRFIFTLLKQDKKNNKLKK